MAMNNYNNNISEYFNLISQIPLLDKDEEKELMLLASQGNKSAQDKLVNANLRFVVKIANIYKGRGLDLEDLISEGNAGLIIAATKIDPSKNVRFITYASWWIKQCITKALFDSGKSVRIPMNRKEDFADNKWDSLSIYDVCAVSDNKSLTFCDCLPDTINQTPEEKFMEASDFEILDAALASLTEQERFIICCRYGIKGHEKMKLVEIAEILGLSRESIRQKEFKIINKLKRYIDVSVLVENVA